MHLARALQRGIHAYDPQRFDAWSSKWETLNCWKGERVRVEHGSTIVEGQCIGVTHWGALRVKQGNRVVSIHSGDVRLKKPEDWA